MVITGPMPPVVVDDQLGKLLVEYAMSETDKAELAQEIIAVISDTFGVDVSLNDI